MDEQHVNWLPHLINAVPTEGYGKKLSMFTIALEGWRRGLKLKFYLLDNPENKLKIRYSLSSETREHHFESSKGDKTTDLAYKICDNKQLTKEYLTKANVPIAKGKSFGANVRNEEIIEFARSIGFPLVIKPINANGGKGVFSNIKSEEAFTNALQYVRQELGYKDVIVEMFIPGDEYRFIVVDNEVVGVLNRVPANIVGDGKHTIRQLIREKNNERRKNPHLKSRMIKIDKSVKDLLSSHGYSFNSIPKEGEMIPLRLTSNLSTGGDSVDLTDEISPELKQIAIDGTKAIPGLTVSGMDIIVDMENNTGVIIEANTRPGLGGHLFPVQGTPRDLPKIIVDYYFPETKDVERSDLYFDFNSVLEPLKNRTAKSVEVAPLPVGKLYSAKYIVSGELQKTGYKLWVRRQALLRYMHGYIKDLDNGDIEIVVASTDKIKVNDFEKICEMGNGKAKITEVTKKPYGLPVQIGFEILREVKKEDIAELEKQNKELEKERNFFKKKYEQILDSTAWKVTSPIRSVVGYFKKNKKSSKSAV